MNKLNLAVLFGGQSSEYSVSLHSAGSFLRQIRKENYNLILIGIDQNGVFYLYNGDVEQIEHDTWKNDQDCTPCAFIHKGVISLEDPENKIDIDVVFPILHGKNGEDGCVQGLLELMNIHYVGCDVMSSSISMDKEIMHILCKEANIPCAPYVCLKKYEENPSFEEIQKQIPLPWIIKPCNAGSSYGVHKVETREDFEPAVEDAFYYDGRGKILVEKAIDGFEIGCAVMGNETVFTGSIDEIQIHGSIFDFEGKYEDKGAEIICPARITEQQFKDAQKLAYRTYKAMNCTGLARVDMFLTSDQEIILNELNTIPGFTATSRYPSMMSDAGISFPDLIDKLIELAMQRQVGVC